jgi:hypothetical protein
VLPAVKETKGSALFALYFTLTPIPVRLRMIQINYLSSSVNYDERCVTHHSGASS